MTSTTSNDAILPYTIADSTPHSGKYAPENILVNNPEDQGSRWSGANGGGAVKQWVLLRLETPAILKQITFGKYERSHPCNVKELKVFVGLSPDSMTQVLQAGLKNNAEMETFNITHVNSAGVPVPTRYVRIEPLSAHGQSYHVSIWHVVLKGASDPTYVERITATYEEHREVTVLRHILKHLRQRRLLSPYQAIVERAGIELENPLITRLHESLVLQGDWERAEKLLLSMSDAGLFTEYIHSCEPQAVWSRVTGTDADGDIPSPRGGHAMCMDPENQLIYLFGGWDGRKSLDDFWVYDIQKDRWRVLSHSTTLEHNAPGPRSCHKMVFDVKTGNIYLLGRLNDDDVRVPLLRTVPAAAAAMTSQQGQVNFNPATGMPYMMAQSPLRQQFTPAATPQIPSVTPRSYCSEFYRYSTRGLDAGKWVFLSFDTASSGGPQLVFDHQLVMDSEAQILYVSGGRVVDGNWEQAKYSGLYSYNVRMSKWKLLQPATLDPNLPSTSGPPRIIPSRFGHSVVLEPKTKQLYIFAGQREDRYLSDMHVYDIATNTSTELFSNFTKAGGPDPCFTQRAVIDPLYKEIYVFCGLTRNSKNTVLRSSTSNWVFRYDTKPGKWFRLEKHPDSPADQIPVPRFAHQAVYHPDTKRVFLHGGNAGGIAGVPTSADGSGTSSPAASTNSSARQTPSPTAEGSGGGIPGASGDADQGEVPPKDRRLDDMWMMELRRPGVQEIVRQARYHVRRQRFREMCEQDSPVKALQYLQTEVSSVVDHSSPTEAETFRSLLTHLLAPPKSHPSLSLPARLTRTMSSSSDRSNSFSSPAGSRDPSGSRGEGQSETGSAGWTSTVPGEVDGESALDVDGDGDIPMTYEHRGVAETLRGIVDPLEIAAARATTDMGVDSGSADTATPDSGLVDGPISLRGERYKQRTEVFNSLMRFVSEGEKEPVGDLLDLVNQGGMDDIAELGLLGREKRTV